MGQNLLPNCFDSMKEPQRPGPGASFESSFLSVFSLICLIGASFAPYHTTPTHRETASNATARPALRQLARWTRADRVVADQPLMAAVPQTCFTPYSLYRSAGFEGIE